MRALRILVLLGLVDGMVSCESATKALDKARAVKEKAGQLRTKDVRTDPVTVKVLSVGEGSSASGSNTYVGSVEPSRSTTLTSANSGTLAALNVKQGSHVTKGQEIAKVESQTIRSSYEMAVNSLKQAEDGYERLMKVYNTGSVPEVKKVEVETALANARAAKAAAEKALWHTTVVAPYDGVISEVYCDKGVELGFAAPIATIVDLSSVEIRFPVPENEYSSIPVGSQVSFEIPATGYKAEVKISSRASIASPLSHSYEYTVSGLKNSGELMPGMVSKVYIRRDSSEKTAVIPAGAVLTDMEGRYVWSVVDGTVYKRHITVGGYSGDGIIVTGGLSSEDRVIVEGWRKVSTGMKVNTIE
ncbi:MAG: efflux RND transporter periplasmic adaptor subunit [Bacteroidales bacterium]|nr:efflux RND transporter periplasmic adaptor subunit [Bacteroidales bacterium]